MEPPDLAPVVNRCVSRTRAIDRRSAAPGGASGAGFVGARWPSKNRRNVLKELDAAIEGAAADHVQRNIGIAVVDPFPAAASGDNGKDDHAEAVHQTGLQERAAQGQAADG